MGLTINTAAPTLKDFTDVAATGKKVVFAQQLLSSKGHGIGGKIAHWFSPRTNREKDANRATITAFVNAVRAKYGNQAGDSAANALRLRSEIGKPLSSRAINKVLQFKNMFGRAKHFDLNNDRCAPLKEHIREGETVQVNGQNITRYPSMKMNNGLNERFTTDIRNSVFVINGHNTHPEMHGDNAMPREQMGNHITGHIRNMITAHNGNDQNVKSVNIERDINVLCSLMNQNTFNSIMLAYEIEAEFRGDDIVNNFFGGSNAIEYHVSMDNTGYTINMGIGFRPTCLDPPPESRFF
jgi:hypothetical protein